ncbi:SDR family NAD(P)-dependent oxidoreductase [Achromobacter ruhlandii]|uniref:SDR family NAD(P)-dependent oxidoreductase n=1 Tax=Achromobacter ruhlandii TaxID=72557 RepID=UPI00146F6EBF|nr:SDR family oxidoreductase [Achromobacter ruhlandii]
MSNTLSGKSPGRALVTGASSGIGARYAHHLAHRGHDLTLVARNVERLETLAARLRAETGRDVRVLPADLSRADGVQRVAQALREDDSLTLLVNNAGIGAVAPLLQSDPAQMQAMIDLNISALTHLTMAAAPAFVARGGGTIINIASIVGLHPELLNGVYGASKAYVLAYSQSLRHELADKGLRVQAVLPGATGTEFWDLAGKPASELPSAIVMSADDMVRSALAGLDQGEFVTIPSLTDPALLERLEAARQALGPELSRNTPAARYGIQAPGGTGTNG